MRPYYEDDFVQLWHGDCLDLTDKWIGADVLVTDPPYGRAWKQGDVNVARGKASSSHEGIANDDSIRVRDAALGVWGGKPAIAFGDLMLAPPAGTRHVLIYDKGSAVGFHGAMAGYRRNAEAIYLIGRHTSGLGGDSSILSTGISHPGTLAKAVGHPHAKPIDLMESLIFRLDGVIADPFAGSGSTLVAAKNLSRRAIGVELEERYCETIAKRCSQEVLDFGAIA